MAVLAQSPWLGSVGLMLACLLSDLGTSLPLSEPQLCIQMRQLAGLVALCSPSLPVHLPAG